jgi:hypothetical protein
VAGVAAGDGMLLADNAKLCCETSALSSWYASQV